MFYSMSIFWPIYFGILQYPLLTTASVFMKYNIRQMRITFYLIVLVSCTGKELSLLLLQRSSVMYVVYPIQVKSLVIVDKVKMFQYYPNNLSWQFSDLQADDCTKGTSSRATSRESVINVPYHYYTRDQLEKLKGQAYIKLNFIFNLLIPFILCY